jgi:hypothetical protein
MNWTGSDPSNMTYMTRYLFSHAAAIGLLAMLALLAGCPPLKQAKTVVEGKYLVLQNKLYSSEDPFDLKLEAVYPEPKTDGLISPELNVSDRELTMYRCTWCHECGFKAAWDWEHLGGTDWKPKYTGEQWQPVVARMMNLENSLLQEEGIVKRIYHYLHDESLGIYDETKDRRGAIVINVDKLPKVPAGVVVNPAPSG